MSVKQLFNFNRIFQHAECMAPLSDSILPKPYFCELCQPRPVMVGEAIALQRRKVAISNTCTALPAKSIRLTNPSPTFRLPRSNVTSTARVHNPAIAPNRFFLAGNSNGQTTFSTSLSVRPVQVRLGEVVGSSGAGATLYQVDSTALSQFSPRFINLDSTAARHQSQPLYSAAVVNQRSSKRKQDLITRKLLQRLYCVNHGLLIIISILSCG